MLNQSMLTQSAVHPINQSKIISPSPAKTFCSLNPNNNISINTNNNTNNETTVRVRRSFSRNRTRTPTNMMALNNSVENAHSNVREYINRNQIIETYSQKITDLEKENNLYVQQVSKLTNELARYITI